MQSLVSLIINCINALLNSFDNMRIIYPLSLFSLLFITALILVIFDVLRRMTHG